MEIIHCCPCCALCLFRVLRAWPLLEASHPRFSLSEALEPLSQLLVLVRLRLRSLFYLHPHCLLSLDLLGRFASIPFVSLPLPPFGPSLPPCLPPLSPCLAFGFPFHLSWLLLFRYWLEGLQEILFFLSDFCLCWFQPSLRYWLVLV